MQQPHWYMFGSLCNPEWEGYELHNFPIGMVFMPLYVTRTNVYKTEIKLSLYEMNKGVEMYNSPHPSFLHKHKED